MVLSQTLSPRSNDLTARCGKLVEHPLKQEERSAYAIKIFSAISFPLKQRSDAPNTFVAPEIRRKIKPTLPSVGSAPFKPEPELSNADYGHILNVMTTWPRLWSEVRRHSRPWTRKHCALTSLSNLMVIMKAKPPVKRSTMRAKQTFLSA